MDPVPLIFSCDTEDYETPASDDAELLWAQLFTRHGIRACFCVVGEEARALRDRGRGDVLATLAQHEVASHSNRHSAHPTPAEYLEGLSWDEGVQRFLADEAPCVRDLHDLLGQQPSAWCKPGNSWGPVVPYAASLLGMPVFCDAPFEWRPGQPMWYASGPLPGSAGPSTGAAGGLLLRYHISFDRYFRVPDAERFEHMRSDFEALLAARQTEAEQDGRPPGVIIMYTHPCRTVTAAFPDNFTAGKNPPRAEWRPAPLRPQSEVAALVRDFDAFLRWIVELRASGRIVLTTYREVYDHYRQPASISLDIRHVVGLADALAEDGAPIEPRKAAGHWLSPAEQYGVLAWALAQAALSDALPPAVPVRPLLGPLDEGCGSAASAPAAADRHRDAVPLATEASGRPPAAPAGAPLTLGAVQLGAVLASWHCARHGAIPAEAMLPGGGGPGRALRLLARATSTLAAGADRQAALAEPAGAEETVLAQREDFQKLRFQGTWSIFPPGFRGERLVEQARRQTWSAKPA
jgi:hypothetical protein